MPTVKLPVLVMRDRLGQTSAQVIGWDRQTSTYGGTERETLDRMKHYLKWLARQEEPLPDVWTGDPQVTHVKVPVRCQYENEERAFPCAEEFLLRTICLTTKLESGAYVGFLPLLDSNFYFYELDQLNELVRRSVQDVVRHLTPWQMARFFTPASYRIETVHIPLAKSRTEQEREPRLIHLRAVADPLADRTSFKNLGQAWERDSETERVAALLRHPHGNVLLVGESGVGKSTVLAAAVRDTMRIVTRQGGDETKGEPRMSRSLRYWLSNGARLIAGMKYLGQWEERCEQVIAELGEIGGLLCIENLIDLVRIGGGDASASVASFFLPYLQRSELRMVAECTPRELDACRRLLPSLIDAFEIVSIEPLDAVRTTGVLARQGKILAQQRQVELAPDVPPLIERLVRRFQPSQAQPGASVSFLRDLCRVKAGRHGDVRPVGVNDVLTRFVAASGLPEQLLRDDLPLVREDVLHAFQRKIIGQPAATRAATDVVLTFKAGLNDPQRPLGVLLLCGPTGVGKTETAKGLAEYLFGLGTPTQRFIRLDMSEYAGYDAARRFIEQANGEPSSLIQSVRQRPLCVILLDEIEKAAPDVFDVLLTVLDEGRLTDRFGRVSDFRTCIIVLTSNLGADGQRAVGFHDALSGNYERAVRSHFRPEFVNRIDRIVTFQPLDEASIRWIAERELAALNQRDGMARRQMRLRWTEPLLSHLIKDGFDVRYGARPLQRTIERLVAAPLAEWLNRNPTTRGMELTADWNSKTNAVVFSESSGAT